MIPGIALITRKQLQAIKQYYFNRGIRKGYELACHMKQSEMTNRGFIIGSQVSEPFEKLVHEQGYGK